MPWLRGDRCASPAEMREWRWSCTRRGELFRKARGNNHGPVQDSGWTKTGRDGADQRREERGVAGDGRGAADQRRGDAAEYSARARHHHHGKVAGAYALPRGKPGPAAQRIHYSGGNSFDARGAVRTGENDARFSADARAAGGAIWVCARFAARRMRDRSAADRFAHSGVGETGRGNESGARVCGGARETFARDYFAFSENYGDGDG